MVNSFFFLLIKSFDIDFLFLANDYKRYFEYIILEPNVPESIKKIYKLLDERKAYRRISDYFHRKR
jgi:hypothetical protein